MDVVSFIENSNNSVSDLPLFLTRLVAKKPSIPITTKPITKPVAYLVVAKAV